MDRPEWWTWELELSPHILKRMLDRGFSEVDLRIMMEKVGRFRPDVELGRWVLDTTHESKPWGVVVEPDPTDRSLIVITAYPLSD